jgi:ABC-type nitrate/sulfonate/bicarbonate transport system permease component
MSPKVFAYLIAIGVVGFLCDRLLQGLQHLMLPWMRGTALA